MTQLGNKIRDLREKHGMSKMQLAEQLGVTLPAVYHLERGIRKPSFEVLVKLADTFGVSTDEFARMSTEKESELETA